MALLKSSKEMGLIPARAGKTRNPVRSTHFSWAHPRSRGENGVVAGNHLRKVGSSPLARGKRMDEGGPWRPPRLIPARAGKTDGENFVDVSRRAHPRSRGENVRAVNPHRPGQGSSPLARGKPPYPRSERRLGRLIPARAGKTGCVLPTRRRSRAHPRSRGENGGDCGGDGGDAGSSPLARGKPGRQAQRRRRPGLIPARAGKTPRRSSASTESRAHPRSRGENPILPMLADRQERLIPARAGKTRRGRG